MSAGTILQNSESKIKVIGPNLMMSQNQNLLAQH